MGKKNRSKSQFISRRVIKLVRDRRQLLHAVGILERAAVLVLRRIGNEVLLASRGGEMTIPPSHLVNIQRHLAALAHHALAVCCVLAQHRQDLKAGN